jgi:hypothetical protein
VTAGSLVGFALAFLATSWALSALLATGVFLARRVGAGRRAAFDRQLATLAIAVPPTLAAALVAALVVLSMSVAGTPADHCALHGHHLHLCLVHGADWSGAPVPIAILAGGSVFVVARLSSIAWSQIAAARALRLLGRRATECDAGALLVPSARPFVFVAGLLSPRIFVSTAAWEGLGPVNGAAALAHERAHLRAGDVARRCALGMAAAFGAPVAAGAMLRRWDHATETLRDQEAAGEVGDPAIVATALVSMARLGTTAPGWAVAPMAPAERLAERIEAVLAGPVAGDRRLARRVDRATKLASMAVAALCVIFADPLHHALETLFGAL